MIFFLGFIVMAAIVVYLVMNTEVTQTEGMVHIRTKTFLGSWDWTL